MKLSIVIPVFNEEPTIGLLVEAVSLSLESLSALVSAVEIIIVDDGSSDGTTPLIDELFFGREGFKIIRQPENQGKGSAVRREFRASTGGIVLIQDADLEYDPADYSKLLAPILSGRADVVYGSRFKGGATRVIFFWHSVGNHFLTTLSNLFTDLNLSDYAGSSKIK